MNHDTLDNRRCNLRACTVAESNCNQKLRRDSSTGFKGVHFDKRNKNYTVYIKVGGVRHIKYAFSTPEAAFEYRNQYMREHHGEFFCAG